KMTELAQKSTEIDQKMKGITERESLLNAGKAEVDNVYQISARSRADLQYVSDHRDEVPALRRPAQARLSAAPDTEEKSNARHAHRGQDRRKPEARSLRLTVRIVPFCVQKKKPGVSVTRAFSFEIENVPNDPNA